MYEYKTINVFKSADAHYMVDEAKLNAGAEGGWRFMEMFAPPGFLAMHHILLAIFEREVVAESDQPAKRGPGRPRKDESNATV